MSSVPPTSPPLCEPPDLPLEILEKIVEEVVELSKDERGLSQASAKALNALGLISRAYTRTCQQALYHTAHLHSEVYWISGTKYSGRNTISTFAGHMQMYPHLAAHVQKLTVTLPRDAASFPKGHGLLRAFSQLHGVEELCLAASDLCPPEFDSGRAIEIFHPPAGITPVGAEYTHGWSSLSEALMSVIRRVKGVIFVNVRVPTKVFWNCTKLEDLTLRNAVPYSDRDWLSYGDEDFNTTPVCIKSLRLEGDYEIEGLKAALSKDDIIYGISPLKFSSLQRLSLPLSVPELTESKSTQELLMALPICLMELDVYRESFSPNTEERRSFPALEFKHTVSPLNYLNPSSFIILTRLSFSPRFHIDTERDMIEDPYLGLFCDGMFSKLVNLEALEIKVAIGGAWYQDVDEKSFGDQWDELDRVLAPRGNPCPFANLKKVSLMAGVYGVCRADEADGLLHTIDQLVLGAYRFVGLRELQEGGRIDLQLAHFVDADCSCGGAEVFDALK